MTKVSTKIKTENIKLMIIMLQDYLNDTKIWHVGGTKT